MLRFLRAAAVVGGAALAFAVAAPAVTVHASTGTAGGACPANDGNESEGPGLSTAEHAFDGNSRYDCVYFGGSKDYAFLHDDSDDNLITIMGNASGVKDGAGNGFTNSSNNAVTFGTSTLTVNDDIVNGLNSNWNTVNITGSNDELSLVGSSNDMVTDTGLSDFVSLTDASGLTDCVISGNAIGSPSDLMVLTATTPGTSGC